MIQLLKPLRRLFKADPVGPTPQQPGRGGGTRAVTEQEAEAGGSVVNQAVYTNHVWVYACANQIAWRLAALPPRVMRENVADPDAEDVQVYDSWVNRLITRPNEEDSWYDVVEATLEFLELNGDSYWELVGANPDQKVPPVKLYVLRSDRMTVIPHPERRVERYEYSTGKGEPTRLAPWEVFHVKYFNPMSEQTGLSPIQPASTNITLDFYAMATQSDFFRNGARFDGYLKTPTTLGDDTFKRVKSEWKQRYSGVGRGFKTPLLEGDVDYKQLSATPKEAGFNETRAANREDILASHGVPPVVVGILDGSSYANAFAQMAEFWQGTLVPKNTKFYEKLNRLVKFYSPDLYVEPDYSEVQHFLEEREVVVEERKLAIEEAKLGALTINEYRQRVHGLDPVPWGNTFFINASQVPVDAVDMEKIEREMEERALEG